MNNETSQQQLQRLAAKHRALLPQADEKQERLLEILMAYSGELEELVADVRDEPESPRDIALAAALAYALGSVALVSRLVLIETAANSPGA